MQHRLAKRWKEAGPYQPLFEGLVRQIDWWRDLDTKPRVTIALLDKIKHFTNNDEEWIQSDKYKWNSDVPAQLIERVQKSLDTAMKAVAQLNEDYDAMNEDFMRLGLK